MMDGWYLNWRRWKKSKVNWISKKEKKRKWMKSFLSSCTFIKMSKELKEVQSKVEDSAFQSFPKFCIGKKGL